MRDGGWYSSGFASASTLGTDPRKAKSKYHGKLCRMTLELGELVVNYKRNKLEMLFRVPSAGNLYCRAVVVERERARHLNQLEFSKYFAIPQAPLRGRTSSFYFHSLSFIQLPTVRFTATSRLIEFDMICRRVHRKREWVAALFSSADFSSPARIDIVKIAFSCAE